MTKLVFVFAAIISIFIVAPSANALPVYARQTGVSCTACHFQSYPALNQMGRLFKAGGYTMIGSEKKVEGTQGLSLPETLNASVVTKIRYQETNGPKVAGAHDTNNGQLQFPDEMLLIVGGRVSENIGAQLEMDLKRNPTAANFKMPFIYDVSGVKAGVIPFTTADQGVAFGFELLNTGAVEAGRVMEAKRSFSAQQYIGTAIAAEGFAVVASEQKYFANISKWSPRGIGATTSGAPTANYLRLAFTPTVGNWDTGFGVQSWSGSASIDNVVYTVNKTEAYAVDAQLQGEAWEMPLGLYLTYANASGSAAGVNPNLFNANINAKTAVTVAGQLGVIPAKATLLMAVRKGDNGLTTSNTDDSFIVGGTYQLVQNVQLQLNHEMFSGSAYDGTPTNGNQMTTLMLFAAF